MLVNGHTELRKAHVGKVGDWIFCERELGGGGSKKGLWVEALSEKRWGGEILPSVQSVYAPVVPKVKTEEEARVQRQAAWKAAEDAEARLGQGTHGHPSGDEIFSRLYLKNLSTSNTSHPNRMVCQYPVPSDLTFLSQDHLSFYSFPEFPF